MFKNPENALKVCCAIAFILGVIDIVRGVTHTFFIHQLAVPASGIDAHPDALVLMSAFGISNFLTGLLLILIALKAKKIVPYTLIIIPMSYFIGSLGMNISEVVMQSEFRGQYMMRVYLLVCIASALYYFLNAKFQDKRTT